MRLKGSGGDPRPEMLDRWLAIAELARHGCQPARPEITNPEVRARAAARAARSTAELETAQRRIAMLTSGEPFYCPAEMLPEIPEGAEPGDLYEVTSDGRVIPYAP